MAIINAQLTTTALEILDPTGANAASYSGAVPQGKSYAITNILVCNTSSTNAASFDMHLVPFDTGGFNDNVTLVVNALELPPGETFTFDSEKIVLEGGDKIVFFATPNSGFPSAGDTTLAATVSYLEV